MARHTLKRQILTITTLVMALLALLVILLVFLIYFHNSFEREKVNARSNIRLIDTMVGDELGDVDELTRWVLYNEEISTWLSDPLDSRKHLSAHDALVGRLAQSPAASLISRFCVVDFSRSALVQAGSDTASSLPLFPSEADAFFDSAERSGAVFEDPLLPESLRQVFPIVDVLYNPDTGLPRGRFCVEISGRILAEKLAAYPSRRFFLLSDDGVMEFIDGRFVQVGHAWSKVDDGVWKADGGYVVTLPVLGGKLTMGEWVDPLSGGVWWGFFLLSLLAALLILLAGVLLAWSLGRSTDLPVQALKGRMREIAKGDFQADPSIEFDSEFGDIGRGINQLSVQVKDLIDQRLKDEAERKDLEYRVLQYQINPHFLNNTLNSIRFMAEIQHASGISQMVRVLADLLNHVTKGSGPAWPVREELVMLDDYLTIQSYRYGGMLVVDKEIDDRFLTARVPRFTFQPIVENAIFHGIEPKGSGTIRLSAEERGDAVAFLIHDDGVGMTEEQVRFLLAAPVENKSGMFRSIGMYNVQQRIVRMFGPPYGLNVESEVGGGTTVTVLLPGKGDET